jgi:hypothetical protein
LNDGRLLVVEYKGAHLLNEDTDEKNADRASMGTLKRRALLVSAGVGSG